MPNECSDETIRDDFNHQPWLDRNLGKHFRGPLAPKVSEHIVRIAVVGHRSRLSGAAELLAEARRGDARLPVVRVFRD